MNRERERERERETETETERGGGGSQYRDTERGCRVLHAKERGYAQRDTIPYRPGRRSSRSPAPGENRNVPPESRSTVDTNTVSPRYLQDAVHTPNCPTKFLRHR